MLHWPFHWQAADLDGRVLIKGRAFERDTIFRLDGDSTAASRLIALPVVQLDSGFLQLFADPASDLRVLVVYRRDGARQRVSVIDASLGVLTTAPQRRMLVALRESDRSELVVYGWRWFNHTAK
jgi:hypothetical protein